MQDGYSQASDLAVQEAARLKEQQAQQQQGAADGGKAAEDGKSGDGNKGDDKGDAGAGQQKQDEGAQQQKDLPVDTLAEFLKEQGLGGKEELVGKLTQKPETEEEKAKREEIYRG